MKAAIQGKLDAAIRFIGVLNEEFVLRGYPGGDRDVVLANIRSLPAKNSATGAETLAADLYAHAHFHDGEANPTAELMRSGAGMIRSLIRLVTATDEVMAVLGYHGEISARDDRVQAVMDLLHEIDPK